MRDTVLWRKIGSIVMILAEQLHVEPIQAMRILYGTKTFQRLHDPEDYLCTMSDFYVVDDVIMELEKEKKG